MDELNPLLAVGDARKKLSFFIEMTHAWGMKTVMDFIPWLAPEAIDSSNYTWTWWKEVNENKAIAERWNEEFRGLTDPDKDKKIQELLEKNDAYCAISIIENGAERVVLVKRLYYGRNADQVELNPEHPGVQRYYLNSLKRLIDMGIDEVRVDLPHLLFRNSLPLKEQPWYKIISEAKKYAKDEYGRDIIFNMETYEVDENLFGLSLDQQNMISTGADRVYSRVLFEIMFGIARGERPVTDLYSAVKHMQGISDADVAKLLIFLSNFDR